MTLDEYQALAARTLGRDRTHEQQLANAALGLTGEAGEVAEVIKKHLFHATPLDQDALAKELGDCLWYIGAFATDIGQLSRIVTLNDIALVVSRDGNLTLDTVAKTFRYLDDDELAAQKRSREAANKATKK